MNTLLTILLIIGVLIGLLFIIALFVRKDYTIQREVTIDTPKEEVFDYIKQLKNQDNFNKWVMVEPDMERQYRGIDGNVGFVYAWNGKKAGEGEQEITSIEEGKNVATEIRFVRPLAGLAHTNMSTESINAAQTKVSWSNASKLKYPFNIMLPMVEKMLAKDMDTSLSNLKNILEK